MKGTHQAALALLLLAGGCMMGCKRKEEAPVVTPAPAPPPSKPKPPPPAPKPPEVRSALLHFGLPTRNQGLFEDQNEKFFMYVKRYTAGVEKHVWQGGQYGFVRDPVMAKDGSIVYTRFHEGMDVAPIMRDAKGEPLDEVFSVAEGTVVYANSQPRSSNYGNYIIIEHPTEDGPFYSLSAHFRELKVSKGMKVHAGALIGIMGYTGVGIDRERAHTHVELNLVLNARAAIWNQASAPPPPPPAPVIPGAGQAKGKEPLPPTGPKLNGQNLVGLNLAAWLRAHHAKPELRLPEFIRQEPAYFKVRVPCRGGELEIVKRYPWLRRVGPIGQGWEIAVSASSLPLEVAPVEEKIDFPVVSWVQPFLGNHAWKSRDVLKGSGNTASLSPHGLAYLKLLLGE